MTWTGEGQAQVGGDVSAWPMVAAVVALALALVALVMVQAERLEQRQRDAYCSSMGEVWQDAVSLGNGVRMPGQCVDGGQRA